MSELSKHLPLSQRESVDESGVSSNWATELSAVLQNIAAILEGMPHAVWSAESARVGYTVSETVSLLLWHLETSPAQRFAARARQLPRHPFRSAAALERQLRTRSGGSDSPQAATVSIAALRAVAQNREKSGAPATIGELSAAVCAGLDVSHSAAAATSTSSRTTTPALPLTLSSRVSGAVALRQLPRAPFAVRAAVRGSTLVATDAGWQLGNGPSLLSEAEPILLFLFARSDRVPGR